MPERKDAFLNMIKALRDISLPTIAAIGSATGNVWLAGAAALPGTIVASGTLQSLLSKKEEQPIAFPVPPWWTASSQAWQETCTSIEHHLPIVMNRVAERLQQEKGVPTQDTLRQTFINALEQELPKWEVKGQDRGLVAYYVAPRLLESSSTALKTIIDPLREDALADMVVKIFNMLSEAQKLEAKPASVIASTLVPQTSEVIQDTSSRVILQQKMQDAAYDVYICYDEADEIEVLKIGEQLKQHGILPWFDSIDVKPGTLALQQQEQQIEKIPSAAVFVGQYAVAKWQALQVYSFLEQFVQRQCTIIPVLLADAPQKPKLPVFLANFGWVDFRKSIPEPLGHLIWGITGKRQRD